MRFDELGIVQSGVWEVYTCISDLVFVTRCFYGSRLGVVER